MTACEKYEDRLEAFHDEELPRFARWRMARHVAACDHCRDALAALGEIGTCLRQEDLAAPLPDLWAGIAARLPEIDAELERRAPAPIRIRGRRWRSAFGPWPIGVGGLAAAAAAVVLWLLPAGLPLRDDVIEELDSMGRPVAVLPSDEKSTIIWVLDPSPVASREGRSREQL